MPTLPTPFPVPPPDCLLDTLCERPPAEQEAVRQAMGQLFKAMHNVMMHDADYRAWSEAHRISLQLERKIRLHLTESEDFLQ
jgi:hypothetical protein